MSEIGDIITDYRQHTRWNGPTDARVAREVPAEVERAITAYEAAVARRYERNRRYILTGDQTALDQCAQYGRLAEQWWGHLQALLPMEPGWYPHGRWLYGYVGMKTGFELVRHAGAWRWPDEARAAAWALAWSRRRGEEERVREFCGRRGG